MPRFASEDPHTIPATPEQVYDEAQVCTMYYGAGRLLLSIIRTDSEGNLDPTDETLDLKFKNFDADLDRATKLKTVWDNMLRALGALYRERRLMEKIQALEAVGDDTAALEAALANVRALLGIS